MNDEIKEILNNADSSTKFKMVDEDGTEKEMNIAGLIEQLLNDNKNLLDYITNLQEENEDLKDRLKVMEHFKNSLQEENEKLKELCAKYEEEHNTAFKLWTMKMEEVPTYEEKMIYKSRCEKAIEHIKEHQLIYTSQYEEESNFDNHLLDILNGGDE